MMTSRQTAILALAAAALISATPAGARGFGGIGRDGDSWLNDSVKNPRFIEPGADNDPARYRASHPRYGYDDRVAAEAYRSGYRGRGPYRPYGY